MAEFLTHHRKKLFIVFLISVLLMVGLCAQLGFLMIARSDHYSKMADELHKRERTIKAARGEIVDRNGTVIAANRTVCTVSVIHNQVTEPEKVIRELVRILELPVSSRAGLARSRGTGHFMRNRYGGRNLILMRRSSSHILN